MSTGQLLDIPPGHYNWTDCGINISADNITIRAPFGKVVLDCVGSNRHMIVTGNHVEINGFVLLRGATPEHCDGNFCADQNGGCILILGIDTVIRNTRAQDCSAWRNGGAISVSYSATVVLDGVQINNSTGFFGGGIWSAGSLTLDNCSFSGNTADTDGGAVFLQGPTAFLIAHNAWFGDNVAVSGSGGAITIRTVMSTGRIPQATCTGTLDGHGGTVTLLGGVRLHNNTAGLIGGAIFAQDGVRLTVFGGPAEVSIVGNSATRGGAIVARTCTGFNISGRVTISSNAATGEGDGGALYGAFSVSGFLSGDVLLEGNAASEANSGYGGAVFMTDDSFLTISGSVRFLSNQALAGAGGAVYAQLFSTVNISGNVLFRNNTALYGGAVCQLGTQQQTSSTLILFDGDVQLVDNQGMEGGAAYIQSAAMVVTGRVAFVGNSASDAGGAVQTQSSSLSVRGNVSFVNNSAETGGAVFAFLLPGLDVDQGALFQGNRAQQLGGAVAAAGTSVALRGYAAFEENLAGSGGAVALW